MIIVLGKCPQLRLVTLMNLTDTSVYPRKDSPYWWIKYWCPQRLKWRAKSTEHRKDDPQGYKRALVIARELSADARAVKQLAPSSRWATWVPDWLKMKHRNSPLTLSSELGRWHWLDAYLTEKKIHGPQGMSYLLGYEYMTWRTSQVKRVSKKHPSHNTARMELSLMSRIMREAVHRGLIPANPLERMGIKKERAAEKPELTDADIATIREALASKEGHLPLKERWMTICFEIGLCQGCRVSETSVLLADIDENLGRIQFHAKRHNIFTTLLHPGLVPLIRSLRAEGAVRTCVLPPMLTKEWHWFFKGRPERGWKGICPKASFHCTRVTAITRMARLGVPIQQAMAYVGHADQTVHRIYQRLQAADLTLCAAALKFFPDSGRPQTPDAGEANSLAKLAS